MLHLQDVSMLFGLRRVTKSALIRKATREKDKMKEELRLI